MTDNTHLPRWAYIVLALLAAVIGLASSAVTTQFFILGLERTEANTLARNILISAGILMVVTELASFGLSSLLPKKLLRALRWRLIACGFVLLAFEGYTIYVTQITLEKSSQSISSSVSTRMANLSASIASKRATVAGLRANADGQSRSVFASSRAAGGEALRQAIEIERQIEPMAAELASIEAGKTTTVTEAIGEGGMRTYSVSRALLISAMGLFMFSASGSLLRAAADARPSRPARPTTPETATPKTGSALPRWTVGAMPKPTPAYAAAAVPLGAMGAPLATFAPPLPTPPSISVPSVVKHAQPAQEKVTRQGAANDAPLSTSPSAPSQAKPAAAPGASKQTHQALKGASKQTHQAPKDASKQTQMNDAAPKAKRSHKASTAVADGKKMDTGTGPHDGYRFRRVQAAIQAKTLVPGLRPIQRAEGGGAPTVRNYLAKMVETHVIKLNADGTYELLAADESQLVLEV